MYGSRSSDFDSFIGEIKELINPYQTKKMLLTEDQTVHLDRNWKAVFDNFGELYHVEHIHPQHQLIFDCPAQNKNILIMVTLCLNRGIYS